MTPPVSSRRAGPLLLLVALLLGLAGCGSGSSTSSAASSKPAGMATIAEASLPAEARDVIKRLDDGGSFQYRQDGVTFQNRERLLPSEPSGYYREYTVTTPGQPDRGARRIITGREGAMYYTDDHYASFRLVVEGR